MASSWIAGRQAHQPYFTLKFILRIFALISTIAGVVSAVIVDYGDWAFTYITFFLGAWVISFVWNLVWLLVHIRRQRAIAPGVPVAFDLIAFCWYCVATSFGWLQYDAMVSFGGVYWEYTTGDPRFLNAPYAVLVCVAVSSSFAIVSAFLHFWLFVHACVDEDRRRKARRAMPTEDKVVNVTESSQETKPPTFCVDCAQPIQSRCSHCAAMLAAQEMYTTPRDYESGLGKIPESEIASVDSVDLEKKTVIRDSLR